MTGNTIADRIPAFRLPDVKLLTYPAKAGPVEQPMSPAKANKAYNAVPPFFNTDALLSVPGHMIPTEKPQMPQPNRLTIGFLENGMIR